MKRLVVSLVLLAVLNTLPAAFAQESRKPASAGKKAANPDRILGMKDALADIEKGRLKLKTIPPPASPWYGDYLNLLKNECGIDNVYVDTKLVSDAKSAATIQGYNDLMLLEIEHRHGQGILGKLAKKAEEDYLKARKIGK